MMYVVVRQTLHNATEEVCAVRFTEEAAQARAKELGQEVFDTADDGDATKLQIGIGFHGSWAVEVHDDDGYLAGWTVVTVEDAGQEIAEVLASCKPSDFEAHLFQERYSGQKDQWHDVVMAFAYLASQSPNFDKDQFLRLCGHE